MGILNKKGALYYATGIDNSGLYKGRQEAVGIVKGLMRDISKFDVFVGIGTSAVSAFALAAKSAYQFEKQFQSSMLEVATISDEVSNNFKKYQQQIIDLTTDKGISVYADEASKALYQIVSAGHDGADGMKILEASAKAAIGGVTDTSTAADAITSLLNAYGKGASEAMHVSDLLFTTVRLGKTTFGELGKYIAQVTPVAASYGVEMEQVLGAVATLTASGIPTAQAMTQIRQAIIATSKYMGDGAFATKSLQEVLNELVASANGSESALRKMIPETEAVTAILGLTGIKAQKAASDLNAMNDVVGASEKAFEKMKGSVDNQLKLLTNNITASLRPLGTTVLENVSSVAEAVNKAFANGDMERVLSTVNELLKIGAIAWASWRVSILLNNIAIQANSLLTTYNIETKKRSVALTWANVSALKKQTIAQLQSNVAALANPYVAVAAALALLTYGVYKYVTAETSAEFATRLTNKRLKEQQEYAENEREKVGKLIDSIKDETSTRVKKNEALETLQGKYPELFKNMDIEAVKALKIADAYRKVNEQIENKGIAENKDELRRIDEILGRSKNKRIGSRSIGKVISTKDRYTAMDLLGMDKNSTNETMTSLSVFYERLKKRKQELSGILWKQEGDKAKADFDSLSITEKKLKKQKEIAAIEKDLQLLNAKYNVEYENTGKVSKETVEAIKVKRAEIATIKEVVAGYDKENKYLRTKKKLLKEIAEQNKIIGSYEDKYSKGVDVTKEEKRAYELAIKKKKQLEKELSGNSGKSPNNSDNTSGSQLNIQQSILNSEMSLARERIALMKDGKEKAMEQSAQEWKERKAQIDKDKAELIEKYKEIGEEMPQNIAIQFTQRYNLNDEQKGKRDNSIEKEYSDTLKERIGNITDVFLSDEEKKRQATKKRYDDERKWAKQQFASKSISRDEYSSFMSKVNEAEQKEQYARLLEGLNDFKQQEQDITTEWNAKITEATTLGDEELRKQLIQGKADALSELNAQMLMQSEEWQKLFQDMDRMAASEISKLLNTVKAKARGLKLNPADMKAVYDNIEKGEDVVRQKNPFKALSNSIKNYKKDSKEASGSTDYKDIARDAGATLDTVGASFNAVTEGLMKMGLTGDEETQKLLGNISSMVNGAATLAKGIASGNPVDIISGSITFLTSAFEVFDSRSRKANREIKKHAENIKELQKEYRNLERAIDSALGSEQYDNMLDLNKNRENQIKELDGMIRAEKSKKKKKRDNGKIEEWEEQKRQLREDIEDTKTEILEDLLTTDIKSFAGEIASTVVDGISEGMDSLGDAIDDNLDDLMTGIIKKQFNVKVVQEMLKPMLDYAEKATEDANLSNSEIKEIARLGKNAKAGILKGWEGWAQIIKELGLDDTGEIKDGVTGELKAELTEQTGSQLVGLWNMTAMDIRAIKEWIMANKDSKTLDLNEVLSGIYTNTKDTADNTKETTDTLKKMNDTLEEIKENTETSNSRG